MLQKRRIIIMIAILILMFMAIVIQSILFLNSRPSLVHEEKIVNIPRGMPLREISTMLEDETVISSAKTFMIFVRLTGKARDIKSAEYQFFTDMTPKRVLEILTKGVPYLRHVTIPEGSNMRQIAKFFAENKITTEEDFMRAATNRELLGNLNISADSAEGYLFPETYSFPRNSEAERVIKAMITIFEGAYEPSWDELAGMFNLTRHQLVTLASIIEKETSIPEERQLISAVFHNRLKIGMRLQSDPTVIYGIDNFDGNLKKKHLLTPHPYNTYTRRGLPPGPIASPGKESIRAALFPAQVPYLYFVSKNDGTHVFSSTYQEHIRAVQRHQIRKQHK